MINSIDEIISSIRKGEMIIIMDDENRENEGDLVMASQFICLLYTSPSPRDRG